MSPLLQGRTAIVTGGATGIGLAVAERFVAEGADVVIAGRTADALHREAARVGARAVICDVTSLGAVEALFATAAADGRRVDILVNNAGMSGPVGDLAGVDLDEWRACIELNLFGAMHCMRVAARVMSAHGSGSIINMSSRMGLHGYPMRTAYCATKFAIIGMTEALAREVGPHGVRVNALCPGAISGELMDRVVARRAAAENREPEEIIKQNYTDVAALRRWVDPTEVADAALFYASDLSSAITGERTKIDAGRF